MIGLLDVADVVQVSTVRSDAFDALGCALHSEAVNVCAPITRVELSGSSGGSDSSSGFDRSVFAVVTSLSTRAICSPGIEERVVQDAVVVETEKAAGKVLWGDLGDNADVNLTGPLVNTVVAGADAVASVGAALVEFWTRAVGVANEDAILHLGVNRLLEVTTKGAIEGGVLKNLGIRVATSPGYPPNGIAVTGPITVELGPVQTLPTHDISNNDLLTEANRLGAIQFDPCTAVRVA